MTIRKTLLVIETIGRTASALDKWLRENGRHGLWVKQPDVAIPLIDSKDRICAVLLVDDDPAEDSLINNLKILKQWSQEVPVVVATDETNGVLEKTVRKLGVFYYHTVDNGIDELKTAVECAFEKALKDNLFMTLSGGVKGRRKPC